MNRKPRSIIYVCSAIKNSKLISIMIESSTMEEAYASFEKENEIKPSSVLGPFFQKKTGMLNKNFDLKFKVGETNHSIYDGWNVTAMPLLNPPDCVFVIFNNRVDGQKAPKPRSIVLNASELP